MSGYAAFLRAINVGGRRLTNELLRSHVDDLGFREVRTFRASGNVIFAGESNSAAQVRSRIEAGLQNALGYEVITFIRSAEQLQKIAAQEPFTARELEASSGKPQVALLRKKASAAAQRELVELAGERDRLFFEACELHWLPSGGVRDSALDMKTIERVLGPMTVRTKGTVEQVARLTAEIE